MKETSGKDKGFKIVDKRRFIEKEETSKEEDKKEKDETGEEGRFREKGEESIPFPPVDFSTFLYSLATSVYYHLGNLEDPGTGKKEKNLPMARHTIDIIGMLRDKTKGNLTEEEARLIDELLYNLKLRYLSAADSK